MAVTFKKSFSRFGPVGAGVAICLIALAYYSNSRDPHLVSDPRFFVYLCPTSLALLGTEFIGTAGLIETFSFIVLTNALLYATIAWLVTSITHHLSTLVKNL